MRVGCSECPRQGTQSIPPGGSWLWHRVCHLLRGQCCGCRWGYAIDGVEQGRGCFGVDGYAEHDRVLGQVVADFEVERVVEAPLLFLGEQGDVDRGKRQGLDQAEVGGRALLLFAGELMILRITGSSWLRTLCSTTGTLPEATYVRFRRPYAMGGGRLGPTSSGNPALMPYC